VVGDHRKQSGPQGLVIECCDQLLEVCRRCACDRPRVFESPSESFTPRDEYCQDECLDDVCDFCPVPFPATRRGTESM